MSATKTATVSCSTQHLSRSAPRFFIAILLPIIGAVAVSGALFVLYFFNPAQSGFYPLCLFHSTTGLLCPGCGSLRAMHQLLHGNVIAALHCNLLLVGSVPLLAAFGVQYVFLKQQKKPLVFRVHTVWLYALTAALVVFSVLRNLPAEPFSWLRP